MATMAYQANRCAYAIRDLGFCQIRRTSPERHCESLGEYLGRHPLTDLTDAAKWGKLFDES
jgi:hypothetical protein